MEDSSDIQTEVLELTAQDDLAGCVPVMRLLRPHLPDDVVQVVARLRRQMGQGYRLLAIRRQGRPVALAGFRLQENLVFGRFVYVDDVVVDDNERRQGHAERLLSAVRDVAVAANCGIVALDTALSNEAAQRVYHRCGYETVAYHLIQRLPA
ncbi:GNAT family N-acetyltransferase [Sphingomonas sp. BK235]|uniref:GNAT family N-acetyltransferase n=1 Tax=Sphingomonas sp. BK235 TaxID=2512131 RepID=UPI00104D4E8F|nr:GNAT family N-acetyltransferase [Sphingomonas sp. BK235]TCP36076.1 acetyltransferase (GNAT) family protein [Sphingomonas sp. BK235]